MNLIRNKPEIQARGLEFTLNNKLLDILFNQENNINVYFKRNNEVEVKKQKHFYIIVINK
jgi:hypothetical protein